MTRAASCALSPATGGPASPTCWALIGASLQPPSRVAAPRTIRRAWAGRRFIGRRFSMIPGCGKRSCATSPLPLDDRPDLFALADAEDVSPGHQLEDADRHLVF